MGEISSQAARHLDPARLIAILMKMVVFRQCYHSFNIRMIPGGATLMCVCAVKDHSRLPNISQTPRYFNTIHVPAIQVTKYVIQFESSNNNFQLIIKMSSSFLLNVKRSRHTLI